MTATFTGIEGKWEIAQEQPGTVSTAWFSLIDRENSMVRGHLFSLDLAASIAKGLNEAVVEDEQPEEHVETRAGRQVRRISRRQVLDRLAVLLAEMVPEPRECGHDKTGDGSPVGSCPDCTHWSQATFDAEHVRAALEDIKQIR